MFQQLNEEDGITIMLVTHDAQVAKHARHIIQIHDGSSWTMFLPVAGNFAEARQKERFRVRKGHNP